MSDNADIHRVREYVTAGNYDFYDHAFTEAKKDGVRSTDVAYVLLTGKVIEEYPERERLLVYGRMPDGIPLHVVCDFQDEAVMYILTVYIPSSVEWISFQIRNPQPKKKR